ncbi:efflux RND transporter periplasmic adaptor subunit [Candidatus Nomurabacteria bacterium]|nr:efflux RND transporter periplasmic adaptor subunit [Candidatus Nomurabacteria bacterium]
MRKYIKIERKRLVTILVVALLVILAGYRILSAQTGKQEEAQIPRVTLLATSDLVKEQDAVNVVGELEALEQVELRSQATGQVQYIGAKIGDPVKRGQVLLRLSNADLYAQLQQAYASIEDAQIGVEQTKTSLNQTQIKLDEMTSGARSEEKDIALTQVENAQKQLKVTEQKAKADLQDIYNDIPSFLNDIYISADDALNRQISSVFGNTQEYSSDLPRLVFDSYNSQAKIDAEWGRHLARTKMNQFKQEIDALIPDNQQRYLYLAQARKYMASFLPFLEASVDATDAAIGLGETERNNYKGQINTARSTLNGLVTRIEDYIQRIDQQKIANQNAITAAQNAVDLAIKQSTLTQAGTRQEQILSQQSMVEQGQLNVRASEARVRQAQANAALIQAQLAKTIITSPIDGTVAAMPLRVGDLATGGALVSAVVNTQGYQLKTYISSSDVAYVAVGAKVYRQSDGAEVGEVTRVSPSIDPTRRKVEVVIALSDTSVSYVIGEFMDVTIRSNSEQTMQTFLVPLEAVKTSTHGASVYILDDDQTTQAVPVELGRVIGEDVEVLSGIDANMNILSSVRSIKLGQTVQLQ